jgi:hypothetical protein
VPADLRPAWSALPQLAWTLGTRFGPAADRRGRRRTVRATQSAPVYLALLLHRRARGQVAARGRSVLTARPLRRAGPAPLAVAAGLVMPAAAVPVVLLIGALPLAPALLAAAALGFLARGMLSLAWWTHRRRDAEAARVLQDLRGRAEAGGRAYLVGDLAGTGDTAAMRGLVRPLLAHADREHLVLVAAPADEQLARLYTARLGFTPAGHPLVLQRTPRPASRPQDAR